MLLAEIMIPVCYEYCHSDIFSFIIRLQSITITVSVFIVTHVVKPTLSALKSLAVMIVSDM